MKWKIYFKQYYRRNYKPYKIPEISRREFAFIPLEKENTVIRHLSFPNHISLKDYIAKNIPLHAYYSSAYYQYPGAKSMEEKKWLKADLIFDIDIDHIDTPCKEEHDKWWCLECGMFSYGMPPEKCPRCGSKKIEKEAWVCDKCLEYAKNLTLRLIEEYLVEDLGISKKYIKVFFSGHRGFHIHVEDPYYQLLGQEGRREIADYIKGIGLSIDMKKLKKHIVKYLGDYLQYGWYRKILQELANMITKEDISYFYKYFTPRLIFKIKHVREKALKFSNIEQQLIIILENLESRILNKLVEKAIEKRRIEIDEKVTIDIKRLIRLPNSLHGKTGLIVKEVSLSKLEDFTPFIHSAIKPFNEVLFKVEEETPKIKLGGQLLNLSRGFVRVLQPIALYLELRRKGKIVKD